VSPYLNLNRGGNAAVNYYGLVRPQIEFGSAIQQLQYQLQAGQVSPSAEEGAVQVPVTGHPVQFFNHSHYYPPQRGTSFGIPGSLDQQTGSPGTGGVASVANTPAGVRNSSLVRPVR
jgi:hypothetical protein